MKNSIQEFPSPEVPLELIHHDGLDISFDSLKIEVSESSLGFDVRIVYKLRGIPIKETVQMAREIAKLPEYQGKDFNIIHSYLRRVTIYLPKKEMDFNYADKFAPTRTLWELGEVNT